MPEVSQSRSAIRAGSAVAAGLALIVYINSLPNGFMADDGQAIAFSAVAGPPSNWRAFLVTPAAVVLRGGTTGTYAPLASEQGLAVLILLPLVDALGDGTAPRRERGSRVVLYAALLVIGAGYLMLRRAAYHSVGAPDQAALFQGNPAALLSPGLRIVTGLKTTALAVSKLFAPVRLSADSSYRQLVGVQSLAEPGALVGLFTGIAIAMLASALWARHRTAFFWTLFAVLTYGVVSNIPFTADAIFREGLLYLPSAGVCALVALAIGALADARSRELGAVVAAILVVAAGTLTVMRNPVWYDELRLAEATAATAPDSARAHRLLG